MLSHLASEEAAALLRCKFSISTPFYQMFPFFFPRWWCGMGGLLSRDTVYGSSGWTFRGFRVILQETNLCAMFTSSSRPKTQHPDGASGQQKSGAAAPRRRGVRWVYGVGFILLAVFTIWTYGDVFRHVADENYFSFERETMTYVLRRDWGTLFWLGRLGLLPFQWQWLGGTILALLLTASAWLFDRALPRQIAWRGLGFLPALMALGWMVARGFNLFLRNEPSGFVLLSAGVLLLSAAVALVAALVRRTANADRVAEAPSKLRRWPWGGMAALVVYGALTFAALTTGENVRLACRMQNLMAREDWDGMIETARKAQHPTRTIAALHALALTETNQLIEGMFAIPYDFPELKLDYLGGTDEGVNYVADCNLHAGLVNAAYRASMENVVVLGPRLHNYKRMALCAVLNQERALGERYFSLIKKMPGTQDFVERYRPMLADTTLIGQDATLAHIRSLYPMEQRFEQNYRQPAFLGYNFGLLQGTDATLVTSVATCLYSKDLDNFLMRVNVLRRKMTLPHVALQAIAVASMKREGLLREFPEVNDMVIGELRAFVAEAAPYIEAQGKMAEADRLAAKREMAEALRENWLGTYMYYYYCGNMGATQQQEQGHGVN